MNKSCLVGTTALASMLIAAPGLAAAQNSGTTAVAADQGTSPRTSLEPAPLGTNAAEADLPNDRDVIVTGSRIRRPNLDSAVPITTVTGDQLFQRADTNVADLLNDLPQLRSTLTQSNAGLGVGTTGLNLLDLRGFGTSRTLVLVNGRRHVPADILSNAVSPDINTIPNDLIDRVDIVTGSQSATYGSDAIAGVVNFILKRNFDGVQIRAQNGVAEKGFGGSQYVSILNGKTFADGRGNVMLHGEYARTQRVYASQVPWLRRVDGLGVIDVDTAGLPNGSDGFPDRAFLRDVRSASINRFGLIPVTQSGTNPLCGTGIGSTNGAPGIGSGSTIGTPYNCTYVFSPDGTLSPQTGSRYGQGVIGGILGGNGQTGREDQLVTIQPFQSRWNFNLLGHYAIADAFEPFIEAKYNRIISRGTNAGPTGIQGTFQQFDIRERFRLDNPFLTAANRTTIANAILASGCNPSLTLACNVATVPSTQQATTLSGQGISGPLSATDRAAIAAGTYRFITARNILDLGNRNEDFNRETYRIVGGARGTFNDDWNYEISGNYGKFKERTTTSGYVDRQRFMLSLDAGRNPANGQIQCRSQFDAASATAFTRGLSATQIAAQQARLASDIAACVPYNPFGGSDNSAATNYFGYDATHTASLTQLDILGFVGGDTSQLFELPGGPISFVLGGEYRREKARYVNDPFVVSGATNAVVIGLFAPRAFQVKEGFGEVRIPILKDLPFAESLTLNGSGRVSDYRGAAGTVWTWNYGGEYAPIRDLRFRAGYGKAVRAPNVSETGFPATPNFAPGFADPCSAGNIANNPNRQANCLTDLGATLLAGLPNTAYSLNIISGSNTQLESERSRSLTVGGVFQPRFVPGFTLSVDYWSTKVKDVIVSLSAQSIANGCYDQPTLNNPLCAAFTRYRGTTTGPLGEQPGQILGNSLLSSPLNFAQRIRRGIDVNASYRKELSADTRLDATFVYTHLIKSSNFENPSIPTFENRILSELGDPKDDLTLNLNLTTGPLTFGYQLHYVGPMYVNAYEDFNALPTACPVPGSSANCPPNNLDYSDIRKYPRVYYHDLRFAWALPNAGGQGKDFSFYAGVDNVLNRKPPLGVTGGGGGGAGNDRVSGGAAAIYELRGRSYYAGFRAQF